jgi:erythritol kinase
VAGRPRRRPCAPGHPLVGRAHGDLVKELWQSGVGHELFQITGTALNTCNQAMQLRWLQEHEPDTLARTAAVLRAKDWIFLCLTGIVSTDTTDASHTYFSVHTRAYDERILELLGVEAWRRAIPPAPRPAELHAPLLDSCCA